MNPNKTFRLERRSACKEKTQASHPPQTEMSSCHLFHVVHLRRRQAEKKNNPTWRPRQQESGMHAFFTFSLLEQVRHIAAW